MEKEEQRSLNQNQIAHILGAQWFGSLFGLMVMRVILMMFPYLMFFFSLP